MVYPRLSLISKHPDQFTAILNTLDFVDYNKECEEEINENSKIEGFSQISN